MAEELHLIRDETIRVEKSALVKMANSSYAAIDRGSTLTKLLYTTDAGDGSHCDLHFALFRNKHFNSALRYFKAKLQSVNLVDPTAADGEVAKLIHVTGVGANLHGDRIKEVLGVETEFIDEAVCQFVGFYFLLRTFPLADICHPPPEVNDPSMKAIQRGETFQRLRDARVAMMKEQGETGEKFPCLFALYGSSAGVISVKEDGSIEVLHRHLLAGKSFLGMCQLLLGTCDYQRIMELAAAGKRGNIDTQVREILADSPNSPYGRMPATLPFFPFGKAVDFDKSLADCKPEDVAHSLVNSFVVNFVHIAIYLANSKSIRNVHFGGNFFRHEMARKELMWYCKVFGKDEFVKINFLTSGHTAAMGAALSCKLDVADFFAQMKVK